MNLAILFILGAIIGSFLNVVASRWGTGEGVMGRSRCPLCGIRLRWFELVPFLSFALQKGKCFTCATPISWQYPLVELFTGLLFITVPPVLLPVFCLYVVISIYDFHNKIIPDPLVYSAIVLSFVYALLNLQTYQTVDFLAGPIIFLFFASIWLFSRGRAMGFGDAKLGLSIGLLLGAAEGFSAIILGFWIGALFSLPVLLLNKTGFLKTSLGLTMKSEVPFAPFLILGAWASVVLKIDLLHATLF